MRQCDHHWLAVAAACRLLLVEVVLHAAALAPPACACLCQKPHKYMFIRAEIVRSYSAAPEHPHTWLSSAASHAAVALPSVMTEFSECRTAPRHE